MDGNISQSVKRMKANQIKHLDLGTIVFLRDTWTGVVTKYKLIQFGRDRRLQSLSRSNVYLRVRDVPGCEFFVEG